MAPGSWLSTYTASMRVRATLAAAGLSVGPGPAVGSKSQGTLARRDADAGAFPPRVAAKLARRAARIGSLECAPEAPGRPGRPGRGDQNRGPAVSSWFLMA